MSTYQLAERLGVSQPSVMHIEGAEARDTIRLETLRKAADALDCDLVYALVPRSPDGLQGAVHERALDLARGHIAPVAQTMRLEAQQLPIHQLEQHVEELAEELEANPRRLWAAQIGERD
jgi:predicted DNA-binding mobile mystery protein A